MTERTRVPEWLLLRAAEQLRVLGQVARLRLIEQLVKGATTPQELADRLGLSQQTSRSIYRVLHSAGVVTRRRDGPRVLYALADDGILEMLDRMVLRVSAHLRELSREAGRYGVRRTS